MNSRGSHKPRRGLTASSLTALASLVLIAAGCSSSTNDTGRANGANTSSSSAAVAGNGSSAGGNNSDSADGVTPTSITVGGVLTASNAGGFTAKDTETGAKAYFDLVNSQGGVYGRKIRFLGAQDDGFSSATDVRISRTLVESDHVFGVVPVLSLTFAGGQYLAQNDVPFVGLGTTPPFCNTTSGFGVWGCTSPTLTASTPISGILGKEVLELIHRESGTVENNTAAFTFDSTQAGTASVKPLTAGVRAGGMRIVKVLTDIPAQGASDFSPYVHELMTADNGNPPGAIFIAEGGSNVDSLRSGLKAAGYAGIVIDPVSYGPQTISNPTTRGLLDHSYTFIPFSEYQADTPAAQMMRAAFADVAGPGFQPSAYGIYGYWAAAEFVAMLKKVGPDLTRARFVQTINSGFSYSLPGLFGETDWPAAHHGATIGCESIVELDGTRWETAVPLQCERAAPYSTVAAP